MVAPRWELLQSSKMSLMVLQGCLLDGESSSDEEESRSVWCQPDSMCGISRCPISSELCAEAEKLDNEGETPSSWPRIRLSRVEGAGRAASLRLQSQLQLRFVRRLRVEYFSLLKKFKPHAVATLASNGLLDQKESVMALVDQNEKELTDLFNAKQVPQFDSRGRRNAAHLGPVEKFAAAGMRARDRFERSRLHLEIIAWKNANTPSAKLACERHFLALCLLGVDIDCADERGLAPLLLACNFGALKMLTTLLKFGASTYVRDPSGLLPMHYIASLDTGACAMTDEGRRACFAVLLQHSRDAGTLAERSSYLAAGSSILHCCTILNHVEMLETALSFREFREVAVIDMLSSWQTTGAPTPKLDRDLIEQTALHFAVKYGHTQCVLALLNKGASPNVANSQQLTPLHSAVLLNSVDAIVAILKHGALELEDAQGKTAYDYASFKTDGGKFGQKAFANLVERHATRPESFAVTALRARKNSPRP